MSTAALPRFVSPAYRHWFVAGLLLLFAAVSVQYTIKASHGGSAIIRWHQQLQSFGEENIYERYNYPNPPVMALLLRPLVELPPVAAALVWFYLKVSMTLLALRWVFRMVESGGVSFPPWAKGLTMLLSLRPVLGDLLHGNVNLFILFLVVAALYLFHQRWEVPAGVVLGLAIACKVTPALFVPYFLWKRSWKALAGCALGLALFLWLVPGAFLGWHDNAQQLHSWYRHMVEPYLFGGQVTSDHQNQSLPGLLFRMVTHHPSFSTYVNDIYTPMEYHNFVDVGTAGAKWLVKGAMAVFAGLVVWACRTPARERHGWRLPAEFSLALLGMLLFCERTWKHHCVTLVLPFAVLCYHLAVCRPGPRLRPFLIATLATVFVLMAATSTDLMWFDRAAKLAQVYGAYVWCYLLLMAALIATLVRKEPAAETARQPEPIPAARAVA